MITLLDQVVTALVTAHSGSGKDVLKDQADRYRGLLLRSKTIRNLFDAQVAINNILLRRTEDPTGERDRLHRAITAEIEVTERWIQILGEASTEFFRITTAEETPFLYQTPIEDFGVKLEAMRAHIEDEPGPDLQELALSKSRLLYAAVQ
jgi:hypothetical protein